MGIRSIYYLFKNKLSSATSVAPLAGIRVLFGMLVAFSTVRFLALGWAYDHFVCPDFHFKYFGFEWVQVPSAFWIYAIHIILIFSSLFVALGLFYRQSALCTFILFTYIQLWDATYYLNHYYFITLFALLMTVVPANVSFSIDAYRNPKILRKEVPAWSIIILQLQLAIVYIFAGIAKVNEPWLINAMPLKIWLPSRGNYFLLGPLFKQEWVAYVFSWVGMLYDVAIVFLLLNKRTRPFAFAIVVLFHLLTWWLFPIGVFPFVMILMSLIFFSKEWHTRWQNKILNLVSKSNINCKRKSDQLSYRYSKIFQNVLFFFLGLFFMVQILFPFRYLLYTDSLFWKEHGYRFSWRVMLIEKAGTATFFVNEKGNLSKGEVYNADFLTAQQQKQLATQPDFVLQYAHFLKDYYVQKGINSAEISAQVYVTLNGKPSKLYIDSTLNLAAIKDSWSPRYWVTAYPY